MAQADIQRDGPRFRGRTTIRDIADLAGVSIATVSRVLNDRPDVAPDTRETVLQVVREHGFNRNRGARALGRGRTGFIGLTLPLIADAYFGPILSGASEALYEEDMRIILGPTLHEHDREVSMLEHLVRGVDRRRDPDAAVGVGGGAARAAGAELPVRRRRPDGAAARWDPVRLGDARSGAKQATEHLLELGHRRIAALAGSRRVVRDRGAADRFPRGDGPRGHPPRPGADPVLRLADPRRRARGRRAAVASRPADRDLRVQRQRRDRRANAARRRGLRVPDDLSIVGFDDTFQSRIVWPQLTTVRQPLQELGRTGVSLLMRLLDGQRVEALRMELSTTLVVRGSTAPPRDAAA